MARLTRVLVLLCMIALGQQGCGRDAAAPTTPPAKLADPTKTATQLASLAAPFYTGTFSDFGALHQHFGPASTRFPSPGTIFSSTVRGKTFVWDTTAAGYVASTAAGAPANGVRFVLYATTPPVNTPSRPLTALGYADLSDQSTAGAMVLAVAVVGTTGATPVTFVSYTVARVYAPDRVWTVAGFVTDGTTILDLTSTLTSTSTDLTVQTAVEDAPDGMHVSETGTMAPPPGWQQGADFSLASGTDTVDGTGTLQPDTTGHTWGNGRMTVTVNGQAFATITVAPSGESYAGASGAALTADERQVLNRLFADSFSLFGAMTVLADAAWVLNL